ncbi:replicative DNA helicase [Succinimonas sp.]|uniref:replicative DNA helicase n=1 Tax=Succinimonas sp. TaxID=1936151 RepID=UPI003864D832
MVDALQYAEKNMNKKDMNKKDLPGSFFPIENENQLIKLCVFEFSREKFCDVVEIITEDDFTDKRNALAFKVIKQLFDEPNETIDLYSVGKRLSEIPGFKENGINYLATLDNCGSINWIVNAKEIRRYSIRRQLSRELEKTEARNEDPQGESVETTLNNHLSRLDAIAERVFASTQGPKDFAEGIIKKREELRDRQQNPEKYQNEIIPAGYQVIDDQLDGGFRKGEFIVIGARPGTGKTTLGLNIAERLLFNSKIKDPVLFFSLEMNYNEIIDRGSASVCNVELSKIRTAKVKDEDYILWKDGIDRLKEINEKNSNKKIAIEERSDLKPTEIKARASRFKQQRGLSLIVIDYLQYIQNPGYKNKVDEISSISHELKDMAKKLSVPVVALAQLNRNPENRSDKTPGTADLRGSGSIEQDADIVMLIDRKDPQNPETDIIIKKCRNGKPGVVNLRFNGQYSRFEDLRA